METNDASFGREMRKRLVEEFAVAYYNGTVKPNLAEKNSMTGREAEFLMDGPQFDKIKRSDIWTSSNAIGTGYQYRVTYKDKRFSDLDRLLEIYSGGNSAEESDQPSAEERLYRMILVLIKERRLPQTFKVQPPKDPRIEGLVASVEHLTRSMEEMEKRLKRLEEAQPARPVSGLASEPQTYP
jgi:hypothetical protein